MNTFRTTLIILITLSTSVDCFAANYYSDPINGSMANNGSTGSPWGSLEDVMNSSFVFSPGDIILLRSGNHGFPKINGDNGGYVEIIPEAGQTPLIERIYIGNTSSTSYWKLSGLKIQSENVVAFPISLITLYPSSSNVIIENCTIQSTDSTLAYTRNDWRDKINHGIRIQGSDHTVTFCTIKNVAVGISAEAEGSLVSGNEIQYFTIDGLRGLASGCIYDGNVIKDNIAVFTYTENHYDGFQSYTCCPVGMDTLSDVILRNNRIINCTDTTRLWRGPMQGIACFDGYFENWTVENNVVITDHWHGITLLGAINCRIINNTVVDPYDVTPIDPFDSLSTSSSGPAWIKIAAHKNGSPSYNNTIQNNLTSDMQNDVGIGTVNFNDTIGSSSNYSQHFIDPINYDIHLLSTSVAIDNGSTLFAPSTDLDGNPRPIGTGIDIGAYEYQIALGVTYNDVGFELYPNPSQATFNFRFQSKVETLSILNLAGQSILETRLPAKSIQINMANYPKGVYFAQIKFETGQTIITKLIKQ